MTPSAMPAVGANQLGGGWKNVVEIISRAAMVWTAQAIQSCIHDVKPEEATRSTRHTAARPRFVPVAPMGSTMTVRASTSAARRS
jgi:UV DNA damage repair endonuclease